VLICRGPRCLARGGAVAAAALTEQPASRGIDDDQVLVTSTGCLFPCTLGPVVAVYPDDVWYGGVDPELAHRIASQHLVDGEPVSDARLPRGRRS
jgi:(2Fe-2S) ferredoxin